MNKKTLSIILVFIIALTITGTVYADDTGVGDDDTCDDNAAPDPGVSSGQDETKTSTIKWILPHGDTYIIDDGEVNIVLDWESLDVTSEREVGEGNVTFIGIGGSTDGDDSSSTTCGSGGGRGNCSSSSSNNGNGNGSDNGNGGGPLPSSDCGSVDPGGDRGVHQPGLNHRKQDQ